MIHARVFAQHLQKYSGHPVTIKAVPGAAGVTAANYLYNVAEKDGTVIGLVQNNTPLEPLFGTKEARYDATKFNWLGTPIATLCAAQAGAAWPLIRAGKNAVASIAAVLPEK